MAIKDGVKSLSLSRLREVQATLKKQGRREAADSFCELINQLEDLGRGSIAYHDLSMKQQESVDWVASYGNRQA